MSEDSNKNEDFSLPSQTDMDVVSLIKKMQQQLNFLEKKIDLLIGQSPEKPRFSKPFRPSFGHGRNSHGKRDFHRGPRREGFSHDRPREGGFPQDRPREDGFSQGRPRERNFDRERPFDRKPSDGSRGFGHGDKPFFRHRKGPRPPR